MFKGDSGVPFHEIMDKQEPKHQLNEQQLERIEHLREIIETPARGEQNDWKKRSAKQILETMESPEFAEEVKKYEELMRKLAAIQKIYGKNDVYSHVSLASYDLAKLVQVRTRDEYDQVRPEIKQVDIKLFKEIFGADPLDRPFGTPRPTDNPMFIQGTHVTSERGPSVPNFQLDIDSFEKMISEMDEAEAQQIVNRELDIVRKHLNGDEVDEDVDSHLSATSEAFFSYIKQVDDIPGVYFRTASFGYKNSPPWFIVATEFGGERGVEWKLTFNPDKKVFVQNKPPTQKNEEPVELALEMIPEFFMHKVNE